MASLNWQRSLSSDVSEVKSSLGITNWDTCMSKAYCKWPVIAAIIVGALICLSLLWCVARIVCCGAECCFCCASCLRCCSCCGGGSRRNRDKGYQQPASPPQPYNQYQSAPPMGYAVPSYAQFDAPTAYKGGRVHEDSLPAMPGWDNATSRRIEHPEADDMEMEKYGQGAPMLPKNTAADAQQNPYQLNAYHNGAHAEGGDLGMSSPYGGAYEQQAQNGPYRPQDQGYGRTPVSPVYTQAYQRPAGNAYEASVAPSYHTQAPTIAPAVGRKPVQGSWRDL